MPQIIHGSCSCGRNRHLIHLPPDHHTSTELRFDEDHTCTTASPLTAYIRIPLSWLHSTTHSLLPHESVNNICRVFTPIHEPGIAQHKFCGFCGAALTRWSEMPPSEAAWIGVSVGVLDGAAVRVLSASGVLPRRGEGIEDEDGDDDEADKDEDGEEGKEGDAGEEKEKGKGKGSDRRRGKSTGPRDRVWYESMIEGSVLGRMRRRWISHTTDDGKSSVEWEIVELENEGQTITALSSSAKRKLDEAGTETASAEGNMQTD